jgi:hypothetical protein
MNYAQIVRFNCGCVGFVLDPAQCHGVDRHNCVVLKRCNLHSHAPSADFESQRLEQDEIDDAEPLGALEVHLLFREVRRLVSDGHKLAAVKAILQPTWEELKLLLPQPE